MLENVLYFIWFVWVVFFWGGARSSSVLIVGDCVVTSIYLACSRVVSLTFTPYLSFYEQKLQAERFPTLSCINKLKIRTTDESLQTIFTYRKFTSTKCIWQFSDSSYTSVSVYKPSSWMWPTYVQKFWQKRKECFNTDKSDVWNRLYDVFRGKSNHMTYFQNK
jgi:hypothetical protein